MILAEDEVGLGADHAGIMLLPDGIEPGTPLADVLPIARAGARRDADDEPRRPALDGRARARGRGAVRRRAACPSTSRIRRSVDPRARRGRRSRTPRAARATSAASSGRRRRRRRRSGCARGCTLAGMRSISNVVDVTNYVMHVLRQPVARLRPRASSRRPDRRPPRARRARSCARSTARCARLDERDLLITDGERPVALAAIMGGARQRGRRRRRPRCCSRRRTSSRSGSCETSERLGAAHRGSNRWEKGVDPYLAEPAAVLASRLLVDLAGRGAGRRRRRARRAARRAPSSDSGPSARDRIVGLDGRPRRAARDPRAARVRGLRRLGRDRADVARARRHARDRRHRGGRARRPRPRAAHDAAAPLRGRAISRRSSGCAGSIEDVLVGAGFSEAYTWSLVASDPDPACASGCPDPMSGEQAILRTTLARRARRGGAGERRRRQRRRSRCSSSPASTCRAASSCPRSAGASAGIAEGGFAAARGAVEALHEALHLEPRVRRATTRPFLHPGQGGRDGARAGSASCTRRCSRERGACSSSTSATLIAPIPERILYDDVITFPPIRQDIAVVVADEVEAAALVDARARGRRAGAARGARVRRLPRRAGG